MASDADWVADVRRWVKAGAHNASPMPAGAASDGHGGADEGDSGPALGYEAAHPSLQAANWPDAPGRGADLR